MRLCVYACMYVYLFTLCVHMCVCVCLYMYVCVCVCIYVFICVYVCMYVCVSVYARLRYELYMRHEDSKQAAQVFARSLCGVAARVVLVGPFLLSSLRRVVFLFE